MEQIFNEAEYAASRADFKNKLKIAAKEANETEYWLIVLDKSGYFDSSFDDLKFSLKSIIRMLTATLNSLNKGDNGNEIDVDIGI